MQVYCNSLTSISIPSKVTTIGEYAFNECAKLTTVTLGSALKTIGWGAFSECYKLEKVTMQNNVTSIGEYVFYDCVSLSSINLSTTLTSIGEYAFYNCLSLTSIKIPKTVTYIGHRAFTYCLSLTIYCVASTEPPIHTVTSTSVSEFTGVETTVITEYPWNTTSCPVVLNCDNNNVASDNSSYVTVNGIKYAVKDGKAIVVRQPSAIKTASIASSITYSGKTYTVTAIDARAFYGCKLLTSVSIPSTITSIGDYAFYNCDLLTSVSIPSSVTAIGKYAFSQSDELKTVTIPSAITSIGSHAFRGCTALTYTVSGGLKYLGNSSNPYLYLADIDVNANITEVTVNSGCRIVGSYIFTNAHMLTSVVLPSSIIYMGHEVFYTCKALTIYSPATAQPSGWESDWNYAKNPVVWNSNSNDVADDGYIYTVINGVRYAIKDGVAGVAKQSIGITIANIPESVNYNSKTYNVVSILDGAFYSCKNLTEITIPNSVDHVGQNAFTDCPSIDYTEYDYLYLGNSSNPYLYLASAIDKKIEEATINPLTKFIGDSAFAGCESLRTVTIPASIRAIGAGAFGACYSFHTIKFEEGSQLLTIGDKAFSNTALQNITVPSSVVSIGNNAFFSSDSLRKVTLSEGLTEIGEFAFEECVNLTSITIPSSIEVIKTYTFYGCIRLTTVTLNSGLKTIEEGAFAECSALANITIPNTVTSMDAYAFSNCTKLKSVSLGTSLTTIKEYTFRGCTSLVSINIPASITKIDTYAFSGCTSLASVTFASNSTLTTIASYAFYECSALTSITMPNNLLSIGSSAFAYCTSLASITLNSNLTTIGQQAFIECDSLASLVIPKSVTTIGYGIVSECDLFKKNESGTFTNKVYCEASSRPSGWISTWNWLGACNYGASVSWGYKG